MPSSRLKEALHRDPTVKDALVGWLQEKEAAMVSELLGQSADSDPRSQIAKIQQIRELHYLIEMEYADA